jgi:hypothetical protein
MCAMAGPVGASTTIDELAGLRDPVGILSIYADASPRQGEGRDAAAVALRNALRDLEQETKASGTNAQGAALRARLDALEPELGELLSPRSSGRGRALFAQVEGDLVRSVAVQAAVPTQAVLASWAFIRPLLGPLAASRPAGVAVVTRTAVRVVEWHPIQAVEVAEHSLEGELEAWRDAKGGPDARPAPARGRASQQSASQEDRFTRLLETERARLLHPLAASVAATASDRGWDLLLLAGEEDVVGPFAAGLPSGAPFETVRSALTLGQHLSAAEVASTFAAAVSQTRERAAHTLAGRARDAALSGGPGAVGVADVLDALAEGRVHELFVDPTRAHEGVETPDGRLFPAGVVPPGVSAAELRIEPLLLDRMVARALETDAAVVPVAGEAAEALAEHDGVAATLRW